MNYSFSTVLMTILASNLLIILISLCFRHKKLMLSIGYRLLAVFLFLTLIRFLFPFELPFTRNVFLPEEISKYIYYIRHPFLTNGSFMVSAWTIFEFFWLIGCVSNLFKYIKERIGSARFIATYGHDISQLDSVNIVLNDICNGRKNPFRVILISNLGIPQIFGIFSPRILIPEHMDLDSEEFRFTLRHETYHYYHRDLLIKEAVNLLCILYWWNPACRLFKKQVSLILEMHVDDSLVNNDAAVASAYLRSLISIAESVSQNNDSVSPNFTVAMADNDMTELQHRFQMLCHQHDRARTPMFLLLLTMVISIYFCSYVFILEASYHETVEASSDTLGLIEDFYAILKSDNSYDIYYNGTFIENVTSLEYYREITVLQSK